MSICVLKLARILTSLKYTESWPCVHKLPHWPIRLSSVDTSQLISFHNILWAQRDKMIGQLESLCAQFPFQCTMLLISVLSQSKFGHTEITVTYSDKHCGHWCTTEISSLNCRIITELVGIFLLQSGLCYQELLLTFVQFIFVPYEFYTRKIIPELFEEFYLDCQ